MSSSSFAFIPRNLAKRAPATLSKQPPLALPPPHASSKGKERETLDNAHPSPEERAILFCLALSEYSIWSDSDLRMKLSSIDEEPSYVSLHYLLQQSQVLSPLRGIPHTLLVKYLRTYLTETLDFRMLVATPQPWFSRNGATSTQDTGGGYEVRLKAWDPANAPLRSKSDWDQRMVYVENVPIHYRSISALAKFLVALLPETELKQSFIDSTSRIQHVLLPPHHQDKPGTPPTFKGFALITFLHETDARAIREAWPWQSEDPSSALSGSENEAAKDAAKFGFRSTPKSAWEALRAEYLVYKQELIHEINVQQDAFVPVRAKEQRAPRAPPQYDETPPVSKEQENYPMAKGEKDPASTSTSNTITMNSPYPYGCLIFAKNIHPDTNKTTLKYLFGRALSQPAVKINGGIDYLDFNKGMDTCYLRLSTPECAQALTSYFTTNPTIQTRGLDDTGSLELPAKSDLKLISVEAVLGTRENVYWNKVPEKIRRGAVEKALQLQGVIVQSQVGDTPDDDGRPKKRRKR